MKSLIFIMSIFSFFSSPKINADQFSPDQTIYQFKVTDLFGNDFDFQDLKGKKIIIVNTASKCGLTPQYEGLQALYSKYKDENVVIVGFPANNFMFQEPGTNDEIASFCKINYGVEFPIMAKISVKGKDQHEVYQFLTNKELNGYKDSSVKWNFQKYLIGEEGKLEKIVSPQTSPDSDEIISWIEKD